MDVGLIGLLWCKGELEDKANFLFNLVKHPPKRDAEGQIIDAKKHPNEFFKPDTPHVGADLERNGTPATLAKVEPAQNPGTPAQNRGFFASLLAGPFGHTSLIEEIELPSITSFVRSESAVVSIDNADTDEIIWTNKNLRYVFRRLFEFSIDLP